MCNPVNEADMKIKCLLLVLLAFPVTLKAQDTIYPYDPDFPQFYDTGFIQYNYLPDDSIGNTEFYGYYGSVSDDERNGLHAYRYLVPPHVQQVLVTGVALPIKPSVRNESVIRGVLLTFDSNDYLHPTMYITHSTLSYQDTQGFDCYVSIPETTRCGKHYAGYIGAHALYFNPPILVTDTFYIGFDIKRPVESWPGYNLGDDLLPLLGNCWGENMTVPDSITEFPMYHAFYNCLLNENGEVERFNWYTLVNFVGVCPILSVPDTDTFGCPEVEEFAFAGMYAGSPTFVWDTAGEHDYYQIAYGAYDLPVHRLQRDTTSRNFIELFGLSPDIYYQARVRARCHHRCPIHDTVMWTAWSDPVYFYTCDYMPDTTHQPEGIHTPDTQVSSLNSQFSISPNPARGGERQVVEIGGQVPLQGLTLTLLDAAGHEVLRMEVREHRFALPTQGLPAGVYMATLSSPHGKATRRVVVE